MQEIIERIASRYPGRFQRNYVRGKMHSDPVYRAALECLRDSSLPLLDIGCGIGLLAFYLRENGYQAPILGLDFDEPKITSAQHLGGQHYQDLDFRVQDAAKHCNFQGNIVILDVLHYLTPEKQDALLRQVARQITPGGKCLIRATLRDRSWRFLLTDFQETLLHACKWMKSSAVHYPTSVEISDAFPQVQFHREIRPLWGKTPFNSHLFVFEKIG